MYGGNITWVPVISQLKSAYQLYKGDKESAVQTQMGFLRTCPVVSQIKSLVDVVEGRSEEAARTQKEFFDNMGTVVNAVPLVGHVKGAIHYLQGDSLRGEIAMKSSTQTAGMIGGGILGGIVAGPPGMIVGGLTGAATVDALATGVESMVHHEFRPNGSVAVVNRLVTGKQVIDNFDLEKSLTEETLKDVLLQQQQLLNQKEQEKSRTSTLTL